MIFDQYQRYKTVEVIADIVREQFHKSSLTVLEIGSNEECNLGVVLPKDEIQYSDIELSEKMKDDERFIRLDGCNMPEISDGQYDLVVALDVLEHVKEEQRECFLLEANRVARGVAIICFPYKTDFNESAEKRVNEYYRMVYGINHKWLIEHIENGLPQIEALKQTLISNEVSFREFYHGDIFIWEEMMKGLFTVYGLRNGGDYFTQVNRLYEEQVYFNDSSSMAYRTFMLLSKEEKMVQYIDNMLRAQYTDLLSEKVRTLLFRCIDDVKFRLVSEQGRQISIQHQIYYTYDEEFKEDNKFVCTSQGLNSNYVYIDQTIAIDKKYRSLRFDPIEGEYCILRNLVVESNRGVLRYKAVNGKENNNIIVFCVEDPQIYIDLSKVRGIEWIRIHGELLRTEFPEAVIRYPINQKLNDLTKCFAEKARVSEKRQVGIEKLVMEYMQKQNEIGRDLIELNRCNEFLDEKKKQCEVLQNDLLEAIRREEIIKQEREEWKEKSRCWEEEGHRWKEKSGHWEEQSHKWEEESRKWEEQNNYWQERCNKMEQTISWRITGVLRKLGKIIGKV